MISYLQKLIQEGEHQRQDFKYCINDSKKIARSLVAFANTDGGSLLIGVKDNGHIVGIQSEEEYYMAEAAARIYSKPPIPFTTREWKAEGKTVLQIIVTPSTEKPHFAKDDSGKWLAYIRHNDENRLANKVLIEVWRKEKSRQGVLVHFSDDEKFLLDYLEQNPTISLSAFARKACIPYRKAEQLLSDFIVLGILKPVFADDYILYQLNEDFDRESWEHRPAGQQPLP